VPQCSFHPGVETEMRCAECERYICPKDMVLTPVGYKCPVCAKPARSQYVVVKPGQLLMAAAAGGAVGILGGGLLALFGGGILGLVLGFVWGSATAEAARRASGGHREWSIGIVAIAAVVLGMFGGFVLTGRINLIVGLIAGFAALSDLALIGR
jgi:hypothetical protein